MTGYRGKNQGFSLVEVLVALAIFLIGVLAVATLQLTSISANTKANLMTSGTNLTKSKLEELMALNFGNADLQDLDGDGAAGLGDIGFDDKTDTLGDADYGPIPDTGSQRVYWNVAQNVPASGMLTIRVIGRWQEKGQWKETRLDFVRSSSY